MVNNMSVIDLKAKREASEKVSTRCDKSVVLKIMRDIFETSHIRVRLVYGGHGLRTKSTS